VSEARGKDESSAAFAVGGVQRCPVVDEALHDRHAALGGGHHEGGDALGVGGVDVGTEF